MKRIVLLSGGLDSSTCLGLALQDGDAEVQAVSVFYGQRHDREMESARAVAKYYGVELSEIDLSMVFAKSNCSLLQHSTENIEHGSYAEQLKRKEVASTYVPFRNGLMLSAAASIALSAGAQQVWYGAHADDAAGNAYPDCSVEFVDKMNEAIEEGTAGKVRLIAPFVDKTKADIVRIGLDIGVPYELTWSCYEGGKKPCGKCGTCIDRAKAFEKNGVKDPAL